MGQQGEDIQLSPLARSLFPYSVECKSRASISVYAFYAQAELEATKHNATPVVFIKQNGSKVLAVVDAEHFIQLTKGNTNDNR